MTKVLLCTLTNHFCFLFCFCKTQVRPDNAWKEAMAVFGTSGNRIVLPTTHLQAGTMLRSKLYLVAADAMKAMGFSHGAANIPGAEFAAETLYNCPFGRSNANSKKCRLQVQFSESIDSLAILYAVTQKSTVDSNAASFFSELQLKCACRCKENAHPVTVYIPVGGTTDECRLKTTSRPSLRCDLLGDKICSHEVSDTWVATAEGKLANGNFKCSQTASKITRVTSDFRPISPFLAPTVA
jgi:hypothetical protein